MRNLWAPWRGEYVNSPKEEGCILCNKPKEQRDEENHIVHRAEKTFALLNIFPYSNGHIMVSPYQHLSTIEQLDNDTMLELMQTVSLSISVLKKVYNPNGLNIGINLGKAAGAGIEEHLHIHIVPRWLGDVNFMTALSEIRVIPEHLQITQKKLSVVFKELSLK